MQVEMITLERETMLTELIAERNRMILGLNQEIQNLKQQIDDLAPKKDS